MTKTPNGSVKRSAKTHCGPWDWDDATLVCHNTPFDGYMLTRYYGLKFLKYYVDTAAMSRGLFPASSARLKDCAIRAFPDDESMRKGEELADAKGIYDLDPELEESDRRLLYPRRRPDLCDLSTQWVEHDAD